MIARITLFICLDLIAVVWLFSLLNYLINSPSPVYEAAAISVYLIAKCTPIQILIPTDRGHMETRDVSTLWVDSLGLQKHFKPLNIYKGVI